MERRGLDRTAQMTKPQGSLEQGFPRRGEATTSWPRIPRARTPRVRAPRAARSHLRVRCCFVRKGEVASSPLHTTHRTRPRGQGLLNDEHAHCTQGRGGLVSVLKARTWPCWRAWRQTWGRGGEVIIVAPPPKIATLPLARGRGSILVRAARTPVLGRCRPLV